MCLQAEYFESVLFMRHGEFLFSCWKIPGYVSRKHMNVLLLRVGNYAR